MSEIIKTIELVDNLAITDRNISVDAVIGSIDVNQSDGSIVTTESNSNGEYLGRVTIYPQDKELTFEQPKVITSISRGGDLNDTLDARFDHVGGKLWIADTGNHRVIKLNYNTYVTDLIADDLLYYPHSLVVDFNIGGVFVKGYTNLARTDGVIYYLKRSGEEIAHFSFNRDNFESSSSSSSESADSSSSSSLAISFSSSSSSSGVFAPPLMPSSRSMAFDYVRSRLWWIDNTKVYLLDSRGKQIKTYDLKFNEFYGVRTVDIDLNTGNAFIVASDVHSEWFLVQMNRDNNKYLGAFNI